MKTIVLPSKDKWDELCRRPVINQPELEDSVRNIVHDVKIFGDQALLDYSEKFDKIKPALLKVSQEELEDSKVKVSGEVKSAIDIARINIEIFHSAQLFTEPVVKTSEGVRCWRKSVAIEKVGLYIPGGGAPLFSTVLMLGIPAKIAGCDKIILCTPPDINGDVNPLILYTAGLLIFIKLVVLRQLQQWLMGQRLFQKCSKYLAQVISMLQKPRSLFNWMEWQ
jgi:histidinol dehydrogenase